MDDRDRTIARLALPALGSLAIEPLYVLVDSAIVGHLGTAPLGGLALASIVLTTSFWLFNFLAYGTTARVAFLYGRGDRREAAGVAAQGVWAAVGIGAAVGVLIGAIGPRIASGLGGEGAVLRAASTYLRISAAGIPFIMLTLVGHGYLRGVQDTRTPLWIVLGSNVVNVVLEVWLVYGLHLGVAGSAWGTLAAQVLAAIAFTVFIARAVTAAGSGLRPRSDELRRLVVAGRQLMVRTGALLGALVIATSVAARLGRTTLAAHQVVLQVMSLLALAIDALAIAGQALTGSALGAGRPDQARDTGRHLIRLGVAVGTLFGAALAAASHWLPAVFTRSASVREQAAAGLLVVAVLLVPASAAFALDGILIGASDYGFQQWATLSALVVFVPIAGVVLHWRLGIVGLWTGIACWQLVRLGANAARFSGRRWTLAAART